MSLPGRDTSLRRFSAILLAAFALWYLVLSLLLPLPLTLNGLLDDSFYYLQVARNVASGHGSTFDGQEPTNGYHPLWMLLLVPVEWISGSNPGLSVHLALLLSAFFGFLSLLQIRRVLSREAGWGAASMGLLLFAWPRFLGQTVNLLETSLLLYLYLRVAALLSSGGQRSRQRFLLGFLLGLACLARLDAVFLVLAVGLTSLGRGFAGLDLWARRKGKRTRAQALFSAVWPPLLAVLVVSPYLFWNWTRFAHLQPVSGAVKSTFPHPAPHWEYLWIFPEFDLLLLVGLLCFLASLRRKASRLTRALGIFGLAGTLHMLFTILFMGWGVDRWHFALLIPVALLGLPWAAHQTASRWLRPPSTMRGGRGRRIALVLGVLAAVSVQAVSLEARRGRHLAAVREMALWAREHLPTDAVYGMSDAGVFAYFSGRTTVNLDGLINNYRYQEALRTGRAREYLRERKIAYVLEPNAYGRSDWLSGNYRERPVRFWYRPEDRVAGEITLFRSDEVHRIDLSSRRAARRAPEPNALILYRYRPEEQKGTESAPPPTPPPAGEADR